MSLRKRLPSISERNTDFQVSELNSNVNITIYERMLKESFACNLNRICKIREYLLELERSKQL